VLISVQCIFLLINVSVEDVKRGRVQKKKKSRPSLRHAGRERSLVIVFSSLLLPLEENYSCTKIVNLRGAPSLLLVKSLDSKYGLRPRSSPGGGSYGFFLRLSWPLLQLQLEQGSLYHDRAPSHKPFRRA